MKILGILAIFAALVLYPVKSVEVGTLRPMEVLVVSVDGGNVVIDGGDGLIGQGATWHLAMKNLADSASGTPFFGTVKSVVLGDSTLVEPLLDECELRPAAAVYYGGGDPTELAAFFQGKSGNTTIQSLKTAEIQGEFVRIPKVSAVEGGYVIG